jgi:hypothetical protein
MPYRKVGHHMTDPGSPPVAITISETQTASGLLQQPFCFQSVAAQSDFAYP